jgi:hypothetical protein
MDSWTPGCSRRAKFSHTSAVMCPAEAVQAAATPFRRHHPGCSLRSHSHSPETGPLSQVGIILNIYLHLKKSIAT